MAADYRGDLNVYNRSQLDRLAKKVVKGKYGRKAQIIDWTVMMTEDGPALVIDYEDPKGHGTVAYFM